MPLKMYGVFGLATFTNLHRHRIIVPEAHFHAESIGTSPVKFACKTAKLFKFLQGPTQRKSTIDIPTAVCKTGVSMVQTKHSSMQNWSKRGTLDTKKWLGQNPTACYCHAFCMYATLYTTYQKVQSYIRPWTCTHPWSSVH